jgi:hypothetical protein
MQDARMRRHAMARLIAARPGLALVAPELAMTDPWQDESGNGRGDYRGEYRGER